MANGATVTLCGGPSSPLLPMVNAPPGTRSMPADVGGDAAGGVDVARVADGAATHMTPEASLPSGQRGAPVQPDAQRCPGQQQCTPSTRSMSPAHAGSSHVSA